MSQTYEWKSEVIKKQAQKEREKDVEKRWEDVMSKNGEGAPEWLKEAAMRKKQKQILKLKDENLAPWLKEVQKKNAGLARRISDATNSEIESNLS
ncbi:hypothetical protein Smp_044560 [Schistosoma mansoni]|uniref:Clathrin light chain n=1 Tax=Schistosoma mansoni TaxID=6183 RepID=G4VQS3_SCHMA|nr:hypothetical protein Smp_044560 [Schistosoma mansoni]|eukprot:XP_018654131.1 hypothetical protein Smp_044560 [Schistosoma mansoni]